MLIRHEILEKIRQGEVTLQFRRWRRPTVKAGGTLLTKVGQLRVESIKPIEANTIRHLDARQAGHADADALRADLSTRDGQIYRVRLRFLGEDPRTALRASVPEGAALTELAEKVQAFDRRSKSGPWAINAMRAIASRPAVRAGDLAAAAGMERKDFKARIRKLKALGLTESLAVGYRLSPRGEAVLRAIEA